VSEAWKTEVGAGKSIKWPLGLGAKGNEGVTGQVKTVPGALGYLEAAYAVQNKLTVAAVKNQAGKFIAPSPEAVSAAANDAELSDKLTASLVNPKGENSYPIASYSYVLVFENAKDATKGEALAKFLWWASHEGQQYAKELHYAPLPEPVVKRVESRLKQLSAGGKQLLSGI
jgi:phosphate transport system substrate-binding protein